MVFLYARRDLLPTLEPAITGWFATREPFSFDNQHLDYHPTARRLEHGTPPAPVFFIAQGGLDIISEVTPARIRERQGELTDHVIARADEAGLPVRTPRDRSARGGVVNVGVGPEAGKICHALLDRDVCTDFRGDGLRISPHFFNDEADIDRCFEELRALDLVWHRLADDDEDPLHEVVRQAVLVPRLLDRLDVRRASSVARTTSSCSPGCASHCDVQRRHAIRADRLRQMGVGPRRSRRRRSPRPGHAPPAGPRASLQRHRPGIERPRAGEEVREAGRDHQRARHASG